jgi:exonuclease 3'-5' domain-containing protein 1
MSTKTTGFLSQIASNARAIYIVKLWNRFVYGSGGHINTLCVQNSVSTPPKTTIQSVAPITAASVIRHKTIITSTSPYEYILVDTVEKLTETCFHLKAEKILSVDCEGTNLSRHGKICLLQIATEYDIFLVDILSLGASAFVHGIGGILQDNSIVKVMHDCRVDSDALFHQFNVRLSNVYDLQTVHTLHQRVNLAKHHRNRASLVDLVTEYAPQEKPSLVYKAEIKPLYKQNPKLWEERPLPQSLINYACADVRMMFPVYRTLNKKVDMNRYSQYLHKRFRQQLSELRDNRPYR